MTVKPPRTRVERGHEDERIRFLRRTQQEIEAKRSLQDFLRHKLEDEEDEHGEGDAPTNSLS